MSDSPIRISPTVLRYPQRNTVRSLTLAFVIVFLIAQLWLLMQVIDGALQAETSIVFPAIVGSGLCFAGAWRMSRLNRRREIATDSLFLHQRRCSGE
jgi:hypothetical protein